MIRYNYLIEKLKLVPHPEGGYFKEIYRSDEIIPANSIPSFPFPRNVSTSIYYLLIKNDISHFHRIKSDEIWHYYEGSSVIIHIIDIDGNYHIKKLGNKLEEEENFQAIVPKGTWFAAEISDKDSFALVGCTVAPGFHFDDFELGDRKELTGKFPQHRDLIIKFTKGTTE